MPDIINWELAKNPLNWVNVFFMVLIPLIALTLVSEQLSARQ
jgi:hypothetical protein